MNELAFQSASELTRAIQDRRISSLELLELYMERVARLNPDINAIVATDFESARDRARKADDALAKGENWGVLHGLPVTIKDSIEVTGMPCTSCRISGERRPSAIHRSITSGPAAGFSLEASPTR